MSPSSYSAIYNPDFLHLFSRNPLSVPQLSAFISCCSSVSVKLVVDRVGVRAVFILKCLTTAKTTQKKSRKKITMQQNRSRVFLSCLVLVCAVDFILHRLWLWCQPRLRQNRERWVWSLHGTGGMSLKVIEGCFRFFTLNFYKLLHRRTQTLHILKADFPFMLAGWPSQGKYCQ